MAVLDHRTVKLHKDGRVVDFFRVAGRVTELALQKQMTTGIGGLRAADLPATVSLNLDARGASTILVRPRERDIALEFARHVRCKLHASGWSVVSALARECSNAGAFLGEHDLVVDKVRDEDGPRGLVSCELKCRRLYSDKGRRETRLHLRRESVDECSWWQTLLQRRGSLWCGRMIILVVADRAGALTASFAEWKPVGGSWITAWGWNSDVAMDVPRAVEGPPPVLLPLKPSFPDLQYNRQNGKLVASVPEYLRRVNRPVGNVGRMMASFQKRHPDLADGVFQAARQNCAKKGGTPGWVATEAALRRFHSER